MKTRDFRPLLTASLKTKVTVRVLIAINTKSHQHEETHNRRPSYFLGTYRSVLWQLQKKACSSNDKINYSSNSSSGKAQRSKHKLYLSKD